MTNKNIFEKVRLFLGLSALAIAASACAPTGANLSQTEDPQNLTQEVRGPQIDEVVEQEIESNGSARVHIRAIPAFDGLSNEVMAASAEEGLPPEIIALLSRLPAGSFRVESDVQSQPEAIGTLTREGLAALRYDEAVEFIAKDRVDDLIY
jgi:hypothetical protein